MITRTQPPTTIQFSTALAAFGFALAACGPVAPGEIPGDPSAPDEIAGDPLELGPPASAVEEEQAARAAVGVTAQALSTDDVQQPFGGMSPRSGTTDMLFVCVDNQNQFPLPTLAQLQAAAQDAQRWYTENSAGKFTIGNLFYLGCGGDTGAYSVLNADYTAALQQADPSFDFAAYDNNGDKWISGSELAVAIVRPQPNGWDDYGVFRSQSVALDGMTGTDVIDLWLTNNANNHTLRVGLIAHEGAHAMVNAADLYATMCMKSMKACSEDDQCTEPGDKCLFGGFWRAGLYSLMDDHSGATHMDPFHKTKLGWTTPLIRTTLASEDFTLEDVKTRGTVRVFTDFAHDKKEYFMVETRTRTGFEATLPAEGLVVWHIVEDQAVANANTLPGLVNDWGRSTVRLITPIPLLPGDTAKSTLRLKWANGDDSGYQIRVRARNGADIDFSLERHTIAVRSGWVSVGSFKTFGPFWVPALGSFKAVMTGTDNADLYVRRGSAPSTSTFDCKSSSSTSNETCKVTNPTDRWAAYYIAAQGVSGSPSYFDVSLAWQGSANNGLFLLDAPAGSGWTAELGETGVYRSVGSLSDLSRTWSSVVATRNGILFFYDKTNGIAATAKFDQWGNYTFVKSWTDAPRGRTNVAAAGSGGILLYNNGSGSLTVWLVDSNGQRKVVGNPTGPGASYSRLAGTPHGSVLFFDRAGGRGRGGLLSRSGALTLGNIQLGFGSTLNNLTAVGERYLALYDNNGGNAAIASVDANGNYVWVAALPGVPVNAASSKIQGASNGTLFHYDPPSGISRTFMVDGLGWARPVATLSGFSSNWSNLAAN